MLLPSRSASLPGRISTCIIKNQSIACDEKQSCYGVRGQEDQCDSGWGYGRKGQKHPGSGENIWAAAVSTAPAMYEERSYYLSESQQHHKKQQKQQRQRPEQRPEQQEEQKQHAFVILKPAIGKSSTIWRTAAFNTKVKCHHTSHHTSHITHHTSHITHHTSPW